MSSDLISRKALLEELKDFKMLITGSANAMALTVMDETKKSIMRIIDEAPTAYDVDRVIKQLKKAGSRISFYGTDNFTDERISLNEAIEIVRKGGIEK